MIAATADKAQSAVPQAGAAWTDTWSVQAIQTIPVSTAVPAYYDVQQYASVSVQVSAQYVGTNPTITFQQSNDASNWVSLPLTPIAGGATATSTTGTGIFSGPLSARYFRLNFTGAYSSGTGTGAIVFSTVPRTPAGSAASSSPVAAATGGYSFLNMATASTNNAIKSGAGTLHTIVFGNQVASATCTVYDALTATGTKIQTVTLPASLIGDGPITMTYDIAFSTGLTIVTTGTNFDVTATYK